MKIFKRLPKLYRLEALIELKKELTKESLTLSNTIFGIKDYKKSSNEYKRIKINLSKVKTKIAKLNSRFGISKIVYERELYSDQIELLSKILTKLNKSNKYTDSLRQELISLHTKVENLSKKLQRRNKIVRGYLYLQN